jgi:hypothetical protein
MTLYEKIIKIYPLLNFQDFWINGTIVLQNDGQGDYIKSWTNEQFLQPTQEQLDAVNSAS